MCAHVCWCAHQRERLALDPLEAEPRILPPDSLLCSPQSSTSGPRGITNTLSGHPLQDLSMAERRHRLGVRQLGFESQLCHF